MSPIERLQLDIAGRADAGFPYVSVYVIRPRTSDEAIMLQVNIDNGLAGLSSKNGKAGAAILVNMPDAYCHDQDAVGPQLDLLPSLRIIVNEVISLGAVGAGVTAEDVLFDAIQLFHDFVDQQTQSTLLIAKRPYRPLPEFIDKGLVAYDAFFERQLPMRNPCKTPCPKIAGTAAAVVITCADPNAVIYYTTDGSYPSPLNAAAVLYAESFVVATDTLVRAVAYHPAKQASNLAAKTMI